MMIVKITFKRQVTFPARVLDALGVGPGDQIELKEGPDGFILSPGASIIPNWAFSKTRLTRISNRSILRSFGMNLITPRYGIDMYISCG